MTPDLPLSGYHVLDLGRTRVVAQAAQFLAELGAQVTRLDAAEAPFPAVQDALWNRDKARETLADEPAARAAQIAGHLVTADILLHDHLPAAARAAGLDAQSLSAAYPKLVHVAVGAWPVGHPKQETPIDDALVLAELGILDEQEAWGRDGPLWLRFPLGSTLAAYLAASGAVARLHARNRSGVGGPVFTSLMQGALIPMMMHWTRAETPTPSIRFGMPKNAGSTLFECADGSWIHTMGAAHKAPSIARALEEMPRAVRDAHNAKYADAVVPYLDGDRGAVEAIMLTRQPAELLAEFWACDVPAQPALAIGDLFDDEQALAAGYVVARDLPGIGTVQMPGAPFHAERRDANGGTVTPPLLPDAAQAHSLDRPLAGVKVLDLGAFLAGPLAPMLLGDLGADVIKLEAVAGDPMRPVEWAFNGCQRSKRSIAVQLKDPRGQALMEQLVGWADVVHHNQRMPAAQKLGFGWDAVHAVNPRAIYSHVSSYGPVGPRKDWPGYDQLFQASAGWEQEGGGEGNPPMWHRFGMMDHLAALASLLVTLAALVRRDRTDRGERVAASLLGASMAAWETYRDGDGRVAPTPKVDARQMGEGPARRIAQASDGWIAMSSQDAGAPDRLRQLAGGRPVEAWIEGLTVKAALDALNRGGIPAVELRLDNREAFLSDPAHAALALAVTTQHPVYGRYESIGGAWSFGPDMALALDMAPPVMGQHSRAILAELGMDGDAQDQLLAGGIVAAA